MALVGGGGGGGGTAGAGAGSSAASPPSSSSSRARIERLWKDYLRDPSQWWDNRNSKTNPRAPDFKHKLSKESLWIDSRSNPSWVHDMVRRRERKGVHSVPEKVANKKWSDGGGGGGWETLSLEAALSSLESGMLPQPSDDGFADILHKCSMERNQDYALRLHAYMHKNGLDAHPSLGNHLVSMLVEVGSMYHAQQVFDRLAYPDESSRNSLLTGYIRCGESRLALVLYQKMQEDKSLHPNPQTFIALLKACAELKDMERGCKIHADVARRGLLEREAVIGNALVNMYAQCGSLAKAHEVFDKLPVQNVVSWNTLIAGYTKHGCGEEALNCFEKMQRHGVSPNAITFVCSLKACGSVRAIDKGEEIHTEVARKGLLETDPRVGNAVVDMYAKCGLLAKAQKVFDKLPVRNVVSWTALIAGYVDHGHGEEALKCLEQMQQEGVSPNAVTFTCSLKACASIGDLDKGREIHVEIDRKGFLETGHNVGNALIDMYAKCGCLAKAQEVFDKLLARDVVTWNALIAGYAQHGCGEEALNYFERMQLEGFSPNAVTFVCSLKACGSIGAIDKGRAIHAEIARKGLFETSLHVGVALVDMYAKCGCLAKAQEVFDNLPARDVVSWNALISGYTQQGRGEEALNCFKQMQIEGFSPDAVTFVCILKACGSIGSVDKGGEIHAEIARNGLLESELVVGNALVDMYAKCGSLAKAQEVFEKLPVRNVVSWTALLAGYAEHRGGEKALNCFKQMQQEGVSPDAATFVCILKACGNIGATDKGQEVHAEIAKRGLLEKDDVGNALVDMYANCGLLAEAQEVFDRLPIRDVVSWTALIAGYAQLGESENVFHLFDKMSGEDTKPDLVTFTYVLNACSHTGLVEKAQTYFEAMSKEYGMIPTLEHHTCMVDLLARAGQLEKAVAMIKTMPLHPDLVVWHTVLGACRKWGNVEIGKQAFEHAVQLDEKDPKLYVIMCNIYADAGLQEDANKIEAMRVEKEALLVD